MISSVGARDGSDASARVRGDLVVRLPGRWLLTPAAGRDGVEVDLDALLDLARGTGPAFPTAPRAQADQPPPTRELVVPVPAFMGELRDGGLWIDVPDGPWVLDEVDLALLDAVDAVHPVADVVDRVRAREPGVVPDDLRWRIERLVVAGRLHLRDLADLDEPPPALVADPAGCYREPAHSTTPGAGRVPVYAVWPRDTGPLLGLGMLTAVARHHRGGALNDWYDIRRPEEPESFLAELRTRPGPGILLCSNYLWSVRDNLELATRATAVNPELVVIHGGPSTPKYEADCASFFAEHDTAVHVTVRAEGEEAFCELLDALAGAPDVTDLDVLTGVGGLSFRSRSGAIVRTEDRDRIAALDELPSPYLTGEFDHLDPGVWNRTINLETNRGCPYGCTFCDWGSVTLSRIRKFDLDRVHAEMTWAAQRGIDVWVISDANFGIMSRDVETTRRMAALKAEYGVPEALGFTVAKNTTKHLIEILELLTEAGIQPHFGLSLQSRDPATLEAIHRSNISTDHYLALAAGIRSRWLPSYADLMLGLPGQTVESFRDDLQFLVDHEITARVWPTQLLPNAPMNDPAYRDEHRIEVSTEMILQATASYDRADRAEMLALRHASMAFEQFGLLRHVMRFLQWDHGVPATSVMATLVGLSDDDPERYPLLNWAMRYFDLYALPPLSRRRFVEEVRRFVLTELAVADSTALATVLTVQEALIPEHARTFPDVVALDHDYVAYYQDTTRALATTGEVTAPPRPLAEYGPGRLEVLGDPLGRCGGTLGPYPRDPRSEAMMGELWISGHFELDSALARLLPEVAASSAFQALDRRPLVDDEPSDPRQDVPVALAGRGRG